MRAYLVTLGSHGDVHPFLAIGRALNARGHSATVIAPPYFRSDVADAGLEFVSLGDGFDTEALLRDPHLMHPGRGGRKVFDRILAATVDRVRAVDAAIEAARPDVLLTHHVAIGVRWAAARRRLPCALACLAPCMWFSRSDPAPALQRFPGRARAAVARAAMPLVKPFAALFLDRMLNRARAAAGFERERGAFVSDWTGGDANLGLWSERYRGPTRHDPARGRIVGFAFYDGPSALEPALERFLAAGEPPIVFSLGTAAVHTPRGFYEIAAEACRLLGRRGVLLVGRDGAAPAALPDGVAAFAYAPFSRLFPRAVASVHHGGVGSVAQSLRSGRPSVAVPHAHDQFNNSVRAVNLGVAAMIDRRRLDAPRLASALRSVIEDRDVVVRAAALGEAIRAEDGAARAAEALEALAS